MAKFDLIGKFQGLSMPESGGEYTYLLHGIHAVVSYLYCYMTAIVIKPAPLAILAKARRQILLELLYRVSHLPVDLGWVDFDLGVPPSCPAGQPLLPNSHQPRQNVADSGTQPRGLL